MIPLFSATKIRPSAAKRTAVGFVRPLKTTASWKPAGTVPASAAGANARREAEYERDKSRGFENSPPDP